MINTNFKFGEVNKLASQVEIGDEKVHFSNIFNNENGGVVLVGFKAGQKLDPHTAPAELMVNVIEGEIEFTILDTPHSIKAGEFLLLGANVPHSVRAVADTKAMLIKVTP